MRGMEKIDFNRPFVIRDRRNSEWYWVQKSVLSSPLLKPSSKLVYNALAYFANNKSQTAFPSTRTIASLIKVSRNTVYAALEELEKHKFISVNKYNGKCNLYTLLKVVQNLSQSKNDTGVVQNVPRGGSKEIPLVVQNVPTNKTNRTRLITTADKLKNYERERADRKVVTSLKEELVGKGFNL
jgi:DNA-binding transcriptional MocR family regulator